MVEDWHGPLEVIFWFLVSWCSSDHCSDMNFDELRGEGAPFCAIFSAERRTNCKMYVHTVHEGLKSRRQHLLWLHGWPHRVGHASIGRHHRLLPQPCGKSSTRLWGPLLCRLQRVQRRKCQLTQRDIGVLQLHTRITDRVRGIVNGQTFGRFVATLLLI